MRIIQVAGFSGLGKTLLALALSEILPPQVAYVKFTHHMLPPDRDGHDTARLSTVAPQRLLWGPNGFHYYGESQELPWGLLLPSLFPHAQWIVVEGHKFSPYPKIYLGALTSNLTNIKLVIGPVPPAVTAIPWIQTPLPLTQDALQTTIIPWIVAHRDQISFACPVPPA